MTTGVDTNVLCYALDSAYPEHELVTDLLTDLSPDNVICLNPTVLHETYHTLVFYLEWLPEEAKRRLTLLLKHPYVEFFNQTRKTSLAALDISVSHNLGGRDALIIACFLTNRIPLMYTHDKELLALKKISHRSSTLAFKDPLIKP